MKNFDQHELEKFTQLANQWWDPNGKFKPCLLYTSDAADES